MATTKKTAFSSKTSRVTERVKSTKTKGFAVAGRTTGTLKSEPFQIVSAENISRLDLSKELSRDDLINTIKNIADRHIDESKEVILQNALEHAVIDMSTIVDKSPKLSLEISPAGGILCKISYDLKFFSYRLERKINKPRVVGSLSKNELSKKVFGLWATIASSSTIGYAAVLDSSVEEGYSYDYRVTINSLDPITQSITYKKLSIQVVKFGAKPDSNKKKIVLTVDVKNASTIKVVRSDNGKELLSPYEDTNVELNKKYEYVLTASNNWDTVKATAVAECKNLKPSVGKITYEMDPIERGVTLRWPSISNGSVSVVERKLSTNSSWTVICNNPIGCSYKDIDESDNDKVLKKGASYDYRVKYANEWGYTYSAIVTVKMTNDVPQMPRMLDPGRFCTIQWTRSNNVKSYEVKRFDNSNDKDFNKIDQDTIACDRSWSSLKSNENYVKDDKIKSGVPYLYKIVAKNGWGKSNARYQDVYIANEFPGKIFNDAYSYKDQVYAIARQPGKNWTRDFQGITTDGQWWYITNGVSRIGEYTRLTKGHINRSLDRSISNDYSTTGIHFGDLDCYGNYLFISVDETKHPEIWIFDKAKPKLICKCQLQKADGTYFSSLGWCAVNPCDGRLYTSESYITSDSPVYSYKIEWNNIGTSKEIFLKNSERKIYLFDQYGSPCKKEAMQGGCFDYYNNLYLTSGYGKKDSEGVHVFKLVRDDSTYLNDALNRVSGDAAKSQVYEAYKSNSLDLPFDCVKAVLIARSSQSGTFKYKFDSSGTYRDEPEGLTYFDFANNAIAPYHDTMKDTSLHIGLLDNAVSLVDSVYMKSYYHRYRETELKNIYYDPSNLKVSGCDILDNKILVKRFNTQAAAKNALNILKNFKKISTIGWLLTSSPNHNYEFSAIESSSVMSKTGCNTISYTGSKATYVQEKERWVVKLNPSASIVYRFYAHNQADAKRIYDIVKKYNKVCIIGVGADSDGRIRSTNNLIWLEK